ncbi:hypothetical protein ACH5RR_002643 [Cinchona calisaya]|uniref:Uncharacterized protein n=1 Tax=Cinchona calisaya TaxID=153742 RepID=A0ABD3ASJ2_9GENT
MSTERKEERINQAECNKHNAAVRHANETNTTNASHAYTAAGASQHPTGAYQMSVTPGLGIGQLGRHATDGVIETYPIGAATGTAMPGAAQNTHVGAAIM